MILFPPRPKFSIPPISLNKYDNLKSWIAQYKYNGSRNLIHISSNKEVRVYSRYGRVHKKYSLPSFLLKEILNLPNLEEKEYWIDSELLNKVPENNGKIILFDILVYDNYLFNKSQMNRLNILNDLCGNPKSENEIGFIVSQNILLAPVFENNFFDLFERKKHLNEIEGLILRKKNSVLDDFGKKEYKANWLIRCRKSSKSLDF